MNNKTKKLLLVNILIIIDIFIKIIIDNFYFDTILMSNRWLGFKPHLNTTQLSIFNNELKLNVSLQALIILNILLIVIIPLLYKWLNLGDNYKTFSYISEILLMSGSICSLIDKIFWGGSLDYLLILKRFIIDLKDIYLFTSLGIITICYFFVLFDGIKDIKNEQQL